MVRLYLIRHADPDYDTNRANGGTLTDHGKVEAQALADYFFFEDSDNKQGMRRMRRGVLPSAAYTSPAGRAALTARIALSNFRVELDDKLNIGMEQKDTSIEDEKKPRVTLAVEDWVRELSSWRQSRHHVPVNDASKKIGAIWDLPASIARSSRVSPERTSWSSPDGPLAAEHGRYARDYDEFCHSADRFLHRQGILSVLPHAADKDSVPGVYHMDRETYPAAVRGSMAIAVFCHAGSAMTLLSHLLGIPLPDVHASIWLAPSSVTTVLFDEHNPSDGEGGERFVTVTPRALCIGGTGHLWAAGIESANSRYEGWERPSGVKFNYW